MKTRNITLDSFVAEHKPGGGMNHVETVGEMLIKNARGLHIGATAGYSPLAFFDTPEESWSFLKAIDELKASKE